MRTVTAYHLIDSHTGKLIRVYAADKGLVARKARDRMDNAYGAYRYQVRPVFAETTTNPKEA